MRKFTWVFIALSFLIFGLNFPAALASGIKKSTSYGYTIRPANALSQQQLEFLVRHFDGLIIKGDFSRKAIDQVKAVARSLNKDFQILQYTNPMFSLAYKPQEEEAYAHNSSGQRIRETQYNQGWYLMEPSSSEWRQYFTQRAERRVEELGIDGIFADDLGMASGLSRVSRIDSQPSFPGSGRQYPDAEWYQAWYDFLKYVKGRFQDRKVIFNGLYHRGPQYDITLLEVTDGGMKEGFIGGKKDGFLKEKGWRKLLSQIIVDVNKYSKKIVLVSKMETVEDVQARMFSFTSYLLVNQPGYVRYVAPRHPWELYYHAEMDAEIGEPLDKAKSLDQYYDQSNKVYQRVYSGGMVIVNPGQETLRVKLERRYNLVTPQGSGSVNAAGVWDGRLKIEPTTEVTLPPQSGVILLNKE